MSVLRYWRHRFGPVPPDQARRIIELAAAGAEGRCNADLDAIEAAERDTVEAKARGDEEERAERQRAADAADRETRRQQAAQAAAAAELERFDREDPAP